MIPSFQTSRVPVLLRTGICCLLLGSVAWSEETAPEKARALLDTVTKSEQDRQIAAKQTEIDRLQEDKTKTESDSNALKQTLESTSNLTTETNDHLGTLTAESRRLQHELAIAEARIAAEQLKIAGLQALTDAQSKSLSALARHSEEAEARSQVMSAEMEVLQSGKQVPGQLREDSSSELAKARKALAAAEAKTAAEERLAHDAMKAATAKMALAEAKATMAQRLADNDLTLEQPVVVTKTKAKPVAKPTEKKPDPVAAGPKSSADAPATSKPTTTTGAAKSKKASGPFSIFR